MKTITYKDEIYAIIIDTKTTSGFVTPEWVPQQVGILEYQPESIVKRHTHIPMTRTLHSTTEVIYIVDGSCDLKVYAGNDLLDTASLTDGSLAIILCGGHELLFKNKTKLIEIKQGPYHGLKEKIIY